MQIVFQSGDFFTSGNSSLDYFMNIMAEIIGAGIGAGAVILLYYHQTKRDNQVKEDNKKNIARDNIFYFNNLLISAINEQIDLNESIRSYLDTLNENIGNQFGALTSTSLSNLDRLSKLFEDSVFFHSFMLIIRGEKELKIESFRKITSGIDYFVKGNNQIKELLDMAQPNDYQRRMIYNRNSDEIIYEVRNLTIRDLSLVELKDILDNYLVQEKPKNIDKHIEILVDPLLFHIKSLTKIYPGVKEIEDKLQSLKRLYEEIIFQNQIIWDKINMCLNDLINTVELLQLERPNIIE